MKYFHPLGAVWFAHCLRHDPCGVCVTCPPYKTLAGGSGVCSRKLRQDCGWGVRL